MKSAFLMMVGYVVLAAGAFASPALIFLHDLPHGTTDFLYFLLITLLTLLAVLILSLALARASFPIVWWKAQVLGEDVYEFEGVYFSGIRLNRVPNRLQRIVFGVDEKMRKWDMLYGLLFVAFLVPHVTGTITAFGLFEKILPQPIYLDESLHVSTLSALPVMKQWELAFTFSTSLRERIEADVKKLRRSGSTKTAAGKYRLAQLYVLSSHQFRSRTGEPYYFSPGDSVLFNRGLAARGLPYLKQVVESPKSSDAAFAAAGKALLGFFHFSDRNYGEALKLFEQALPGLGPRDEHLFSRHMAILLAAKSAVMRRDSAKAQALLEMILVDERMPNLAYALVLEQFAEILRLEGRTEKVAELLAKSREFHDQSKNSAGIARIQLNLGMLALEAGHGKAASRLLSEASSLAQGAGDWFTMNMIQRVYQGFSG